MNCVVDETYFWSAGRLVTEDGMPTWKWLDVVYPMKFTKWFPGLCLFFIQIRNFFRKGLLYYLNVRVL